MDRIYNKIIESKSKPYIWTYSRFDTSNQSVINDILFQSLSSFQFFNFNNAAAEYFNIDFSKQLKENEFSPNGEMPEKSFTFSSTIGTINNPFAYADDREEEIDEDGHAENQQEEMEDADNLFEMENPNMEMAQDEVGNADEMNRTALGDAIPRWEPGRYAILEDNAIFDMNMAREALTINVGGENGTNQ